MIEQTELCPATLCQRAGGWPQRGSQEPEQRSLRHGMRHTVQEAAAERRYSTASRADVTEPDKSCHQSVGSAVPYPHNSIMLAQQTSSSYQRGALRMPSCMADTIDTTTPMVAQSGGSYAVELCEKAAGLL